MQPKNEVLAAPQIPFCAGFSAFSSPFPRNYQFTFPVTLTTLNTDEFYWFDVGTFMKLFLFVFQPSQIDSDEIYTTLARQGPKVLTYSPQDLKTVNLVSFPLLHVHLFE